MTAGTISLSPFAVGADGLAINPTGGVIQNTGSGQSAFVQVEQDETNLISNQRAEISSIDVNGVVTPSIIDIRGVPNISVLTKVTLGSLTSATLSIEFNEGSNPTIWARPVHMDSIAAGVWSPTVAAGDYLFGASLDGVWVCFTIPNPGFPLCRFLTTSVGVITGSALSLYVGACMHPIVTPAII